MRRIFNCGLPGSTIFFHVISKYGTIFGGGKKKIIELKMFTLIFSTFV